MKTPWIFELQRKEKSEVASGADSTILFSLFKPKWMLVMQEREWRIPIESDEEIDRGFSCLLEGKETGNWF